ncbi:hypothetical protein Agub_g15930, partial [Astrephomene gubernaculifera]
DLGIYLYGSDLYGNSLYGSSLDGSSLDGSSGGSSSSCLLSRMEAQLLSYTAACGLQHTGGRVRQEARARRRRGAVGGGGGGGGALGVAVDPGAEDPPGPAAVADALSPTPPGVGLPAGSSSSSGSSGSSSGNSAVTPTQQATPVVEEEEEEMAAAGGTGASAPPGAGAGAARDACTTLAGEGAANAAEGGQHPGAAVAGSEVCAAQWGAHEPTRGAAHEPSVGLPEPNTVQAKASRSDGQGPDCSSSAAASAPAAALAAAAAGGTGSKNGVRQADSHAPLKGGVRQAAPPAPLLPLVCRAALVVAGAVREAREEAREYEGYVAGWTATQAHTIQAVEVLGLLFGLLRARHTAPITPTIALLAILRCSVSIVTFAAWLLLPYSSWRRLGQAARLPRFAASLASKSLKLLFRAIPPLTFAAYQAGWGVVLVEGLLLPATCLLSPRGALLLSALRLPLNAAVASAYLDNRGQQCFWWRCSAGGLATGIAANAPGLSSCPSSSSFPFPSCLFSPSCSCRRGLLLAARVEAAALATTAACHIFLRVCCARSRGRSRKIQTYGLSSSTVS